MREWIHDKIREKRKQLKWSQCQLAKKAGMAREYVSYLETGKINPTASTISKLSGALGVSEGYFFRSKD